MQVKCKQVTRAEDGRMICAIVVRNRTGNADTITQISLTRMRSCRPAPGEDDEQAEAGIESTRQVNVALSAGATWEGVLTWDEDAINWAQQQRSAMMRVEFAHSKPAFRGFRVPDVPSGKNEGGRFKQRMQKAGWPLILLLLMFTTYSMVTRHQQQEDIAKVMQAMYIPPYPDGPMNSAEGMMWRALYHAYVRDDMDAEQRAVAEARFRAVIASEFSQNEAQSPEAGSNQDRTAAAGDTGVIDATRPSGRYAGLTDIERMLFDKGADVNAKSKKGLPDLILATLVRDADTVKLLLDKGADLNTKGSGEATALVYASEAGYADMVKLLLDKGADANTTVNDDWTVLMVASNGGHTDIVKLLLSKGADVNPVNNDGRTALMIASQAGHADIVKLLQQQVANSINSPGRPPMSQE